MSIVIWGCFYGVCVSIFIILKQCHSQVDTNLPLPFEWEVSIRTSNVQKHLLYSNIITEAALLAITQATWCIQVPFTAATTHNSAHYTFFFDNNSLKIEGSQNHNYISIDHPALLQSSLNLNIHWSIINVSTHHSSIHQLKAGVSNLGPRRLLSIRYVSGLQHRWSKRSGSLSGFSELADELTIWISCVGGGKHLKQAG